MKTPFFLSLFLHVLVGIGMFWATSPHLSKSKALPSATVVKLVRPKMPANLSGVLKPGKEGQLPEREAMKVPDKSKQKTKTENKITEKPTPKTDGPRVLKPGAKELVGEAGTMRLAGGDGFEYDFYLAVVQSKIEQNFRPPPGVRGQTLATVGFTIEKNGALTNITLAKSSGNLLIDQSAERAVRAAGRFPPLPSQYEKGTLDILFEFVVNPSAGK